MWPQVHSDLAASSAHSLKSIAQVKAEFKKQVTSRKDENIATESNVKAELSRAASGKQAPSIRETRSSVSNGLAQCDNFNKRSPAEEFFVCRA